MKFSFRFLALTLVLILGTTVALSQWSKVHVGSAVFDAYTVHQGETIYSLAKALGLTQQEIIEYNPEVAHGLKAGSTLYFPEGVVKNYHTHQATDVIPENCPTTIHEVEKKESVYGIAKRYGITIEQLFALNPSAKEGIKKGEKLIIPILGNSDQSQSAKTSKETTPFPGKVNTDFYSVRSGDTFHSIAWNHGLSDEELESLNPEINPEHLQQGQLLRLRKSAAQIVYPAAQEQTAAETPAIAQEATSQVPSTTEVPAEEEEPVTPQVPEVSEPTPASEAPVTAEIPTPVETVAPVEQTPTTVPNPSDVALVERTLEIAQDTGDMIQRGENELPAPVNEERPLGPVYIDPVAFEPYDTIGRNRDNSLSIVVMLPFMLNESTPSKLALRYLDFYKGLLIAADSLSVAGQKPVKIVAYDTEGSTDKVRQLLDEPEVINASVVIAPDTDEQLQMIAQKGREVGYYTFNIYNVKDESYLTNPKMMQANINHIQMYRKAIEAMERRYPTNTLVILNNEGGKNEKMEFVETVRQTYQNHGRNVMEITYNGNLPIEALDSLSVTTPYIFLPVSGSNQEFGRIYPALKYFRENAAFPSDVVVFGYPDWSAFRADRLDELHRLNAVIYSRFYDDVQSPESQGVSQAFNRWYGQDMEDGVPKPGLMGFDVGNYLINTLRINDGDFNSFAGSDQGVQSTFRFRQPVNGLGLVNDALYIVDFNGDHTIVKTVN